jgi:hypothetical protein
VTDVRLPEVEDFLSFGWQLAKPCGFQFHTQDLSLDFAVKIRLVVLKQISF